VGHHRRHDGSGDHLVHQGLGPTSGLYSHRECGSLHLEVDNLGRVLRDIGLQSAFLWKVVSPWSIAPLEDSGTWQGALLRVAHLARSLLGVQWASTSWVE
jgi:hypothetical protein